MTDMNPNLSSAQFDYRGSHQPQEPGEGGVPMHQIEDMMPKYYSHPEWYNNAGGRSDQESHRVVMNARNPEANVTIYRAVPSHVNEINPGDWVTPSRTYAQWHNRSILDGKGKVIKTVAKARELYTPGDSINEWGYFPGAKR